MAANATVGILRILLTANAAEVEKVFNQTAKRVGELSKTITGMGRQTSQVGTALTATLTVPLVAAGASAVRAGLQFEGALNQIQGVLRPTADQMARVRATAIKMGADTAFSATEAADAILELGKAGFDADSAISSVDKVLQLAAASGLGMADAASLAARTLNAFGMSAGELGHVNDVLAKAVNKTSLEIGDMQVAFGYVGPIARGFGMSIEEVSAALGIMRDSGIAAETTGRALREGFSRLANPVKSVKEVMEELGISSFTSNGKLLGLTQVVGLLEGKGITAAQALKLFGDAAGPGMFALIQKGQQGLIDLTAELKNSEGAAKAMADSMMKGLPGAMERLRGSVETAWLSISQAIEPTLIRVMDGLGGVADLVTTRVIPAFLKSPGPVQGLALAFVGVAAAAGPLLWLFGQVITSVGLVAGAFGTAGIATKGMAAAVTVATTYFPTFTAGIVALTSSVTMSAGVLSSFGQVLKGLGIAASFLAAGFVGWHMGSFIGEITGATDALGKFYAKMGETIGLLPQGAAAQYDASRAAARLAEQSKNAAGGVDEVSAAAKALADRVSGKGLADQMAALEASIASLTQKGEMTPGTLKRIQAEVAMLQARGADLTDTLKKFAPAAAAVVPPLDAAGEAAKKAKDEFARLKDEISGVSAAADAQTLMRAIDATGGVFALTTEQASRYAQQLGDVVAKNELLGLKNFTLLEMAMRLQEIATASTDASMGVRLIQQSIDTAAPSISDIGEDLNRMSMALKGLGASRIGTLNLTPFKAPVQSALSKSVGTSFLSGIGETIRTQLGPTILAAFQGGGNVGQSIGGLLGGSLFGADGALTKSLTSGLGKLLGSKAIGSALGSVIPGLGTLVGGLVGGKLGGFVNGLFGNTAEHRKVNDLRDAAFSAAGGFHELHKKLHEAGFSMERLLKAKDTKTWEREWKAATAALEAHEAALQANKEAATDLFGEIMEAGSNGIPAAYRPAIEQLISLGLLTDEQAAKLRGLKDAAGAIDTKQMEADIEVFKGRVESLGPAFQKAKIAETAEKYVNAIDRLIKGGADVGGVLFDAREEMSELVQQAMKSGAALPAQLKPWIEDLIRSGNLLDANGNKITDISQIKFGEPIKTEAEKAQEGWDKLLAKIQELIDRIAGPLESEIDRVTRDRQVNIDVDYRSRRGEANDAQPEGDRTGFASGTMGRFGRFWRDFGSGTKTTLHDIEAVVTPAQAVPFAMETMASLGAGVGGSSVTSTREVTTNLMLVPVLMGKDMDAAALTDAVVRRIPSHISFQSGELREGFEYIIGDWNRSYGRG